MIGRYVVMTIVGPCWTVSGTDTGVSPPVGTDTGVSPPSGPVTGVPPPGPELGLGEKGGDTRSGSVIRVGLNVGKPAAEVLPWAVPSVVGWPAGVMVMEPVTEPVAIPVVSWTMIEMKILMLLMMVWMMRRNWPELWLTPAALAVISSVCSVCTSTMLVISVSILIELMYRKNLLQRLKKAVAEVAAAEAETVDAMEVVMAVMTSV